MKVPAFAPFVFVACAAVAALSQNPPARTTAAASPTPAAAAQLPPVAQAMLQQRAEAYLRNLYAWGPEFQVKAGAVNPSVAPDLYEINVEVSLQGRSDSAVVYVTKDGRYMFRGEISDMNTDPFAAVREKLTLNGWPAKGPADARIVIVEFGDFQCPSCRQLDLVLRKLLPEYPQVRLVFKDFPLEQIHPWAMTAALVGRCAYQQDNDTFWKVHDLIYDNQDRITPETAYDKLLQLGADAGLNPTTLRACVSAPETVDSVRKGIAEGISLSIDSTPTTFVNGRAVVGPNEPLLRQYINF